MHLKKLEIYGFKSFADRTEIQFDKGITAVVGPNGSGKSNVGDAVRWVLGEQSAKSLRGSKMEDVIFNGTEKRKALGFAEVSLTLDNSDGSLPIDFSEVTITRRVFRSGESEYYINRTSCRLKDIIELFMDTGVGKEGYSIIGQGRIDEILSSKSEDRRMVFEEAAGIVKYKSRKEEAEKKLEQTRQNLLRLEDIIEELNGQLEPLKEQSAIAKEYLSLKEQLKSLEIKLFLQQYDKGKGQLDRLNQELWGIQDEQRLKSERMDEIRGIYEQEEKHILELENEINQIQQTAMDLTASIEKLEGEGKLILEKQQSLHKENERLQNENEMDHNAMAQYDEDRSLLDGEYSGTAEKITLVTADIARLEDQIAQVTSKMSQNEESMDKSKGDIIDALNRLSDIKSKLSRFQTLKANIDKRTQEIVAAQEKKDQEKQLLEQERILIHNTMSETRDEKRHFIQRKIELDDQKALLEGQIQRLEQLIQESRGNIHTLTSRLHVLSEMKKDYEGFQSSIKRVFFDSTQLPQLKTKICGVVAQLIRVPKYLEKSIEMALGGALQNIVTETEEDARYIIEHLRKNHYGRATFLPLSAIKGKGLNAAERASLNIEGCVGVASELVKYDEKYKNIFENLLGRTAIVKNLETGIKLAKENRHVFRIVTLEGDILNPGGAMTGGSTQSRYSSLLGRDREIGETQKKLDKQNEEYTILTEQYGSKKAEKAELDQSIKNIESKIHELDISLTRISEKSQKNDELIGSAADQEKHFIYEKNQLQQDLQDIRKEIDQLTIAQSKLEAQHEAVQGDLSKFQGEIKGIQEERNLLMEEMTQNKVSLASLEKECKFYQEESDRITKETEKLITRIQARKEGIFENQKRYQELALEHESLIKEAEESKESLKSGKSLLQEKENFRETLQNRLKEWAKEKNDIQTDLSEIAEKRHKIEMQAARIEAELENLQNRIWNDYGLSYLSALEYPFPDVPLAEGPRQVDQLKAKIRDLGTVNVNAIEDYKKVRERHDFLCIQKSDLIQAEEHLRDVIQELLTTMEVQFREQFILINQNFNEVFQKLFGGGRAELILQNEQDVLECGIDIIAQPPGKRLQNLSLLSGGERALTAIAILFAILKLKPTPFCLLDEIEAALDESNVDQFAQYLREYISDTQFVVITHRKGTMEVCDTLYGIAMEERGVSRLVSVRLADKVS